MVEQLIQRAVPRGLRIAQRLVGRADAEDAVQEALYRTCRRRALADPEGWFIRVLVNHCLGVLRRRQLWRLVRHEPPEPARTPDRTDAMRLRDKVAALPLMQRTVVQLRFGEELPLAEIAAVLERSEETVKTHLKRALERLRQEMGAP
jgi:RNA polymerase sigma factor (sigma-70 family)